MRDPSSYRDYETYVRRLTESSERILRTRLEVLETQVERLSERLRMLEDIPQAWVVEGAHGIQEYKEPYRG